MIMRRQGKGLFDVSFGHFYYVDSKSFKHNLNEKSFVVYIKLLKFKSLYEARKEGHSVLEPSRCGRLRTFVHSLTYCVAHQYAYIGKIVHYGETLAFGMSY